MLFRKRTEQTGAHLIDVVFGGFGAAVDCLRVAPHYQPACVGTEDEALETVENRFAGMTDVEKSLSFFAGGDIMYYEFSAVGTAGDVAFAVGHEGDVGACRSVIRIAVGSEFADSGAAHRSRAISARDTQQRCYSGQYMFFHNAFFFEDSANLRNLFQYPSPPAPIIALTATQKAPAAGCRSIIIKKAVFEYQVFNAVREAAWVEKLR